MNYPLHLRVILGFTVRKTKAWFSVIQIATLLVVVMAGLPVHVKAQSSLVFQINTALSDNNSVTITVTNNDSVFVKWDEVQTTTSAYINTQLHYTFDEEAFITIEISGVLDELILDENTRRMLTRVTSFGDMPLRHLDGAFEDAEHLTNVPTDLPATVTSLNSTFRNARSFNQNINSWNVENVQSLRNTFEGATTFNQPLDGWDVSNVLDMSYLFKQASSFNQDISKWNTSRVVLMDGMFSGASAFNQNVNTKLIDEPDLSGGSFSVAWDVSQVTGMNGMFSRALTFNQPLFGWDVSNVNNMAGMFDSAVVFNQPLNNWDVGNVKNMADMFRGAERFNQDLDRWNVRNVEDMRGMFSASWYNVKTVDFNGNISTWDVGNVKDMGNMFMGAAVFNQPIGDWDVSNVTNMSHMFFRATQFNQSLNDWDMRNVENIDVMFAWTDEFNGDISSWDLQSMVQMRAIFSHAHKFNQDIGQWDISQVTDLSEVLFRADAFDQDLSGWDVSNVTNMNSVFYGALSFTGKGLSEWDVSSVTNMFQLFGETRSFNADLSVWDVSNVTDMEGMFKFSKSFDNRSISNWDVSSVTNMKAMFGHAVFNQDISAWDVRNVRDMTLMFENSPFNQDISDWDVSSVRSFKGMFFQVFHYNQPINWNLSSAEDLTLMFFNCGALNQPVRFTNSAGVRYMESMFHGAGNFNQDISDWDVSGVISMKEMFSQAYTFNQDLSSWDVSAVQNMEAMFSNAVSFDQDLSNWDISNVRNMASMFHLVTLSPEHYSAMLTRWAALPVQNHVELDGGKSTFWLYASEARKKLIESNKWSIHDAGLVKADYPQLLIPIQRSTDVTTPVVFEWESDSLATAYDLEIYTDSLAVLVVDTLVDGSEIDISTLALGTEYFWRVRAQNSSRKGIWSPFWSFTTQTIPVEIPVLTLPEPNATNIDPATRFVWRAVARASQYLIQISEQENFSNITLEATIQDTSFLVYNGLKQFTQYHWRVKAFGEQGGQLSSWSDPFSFTTGILTSISDNPFPNQFEVYPPYPNPFNPTTTLKYSLPQASSVTITLYTITGQYVKTVLNQRQKAGLYEVEVDGALLPSGSYILILKSNQQSESVLLQLIK